MAETELHILKSRRMLPLFIAQFLGAVNDNLLKVGLVTLITFQPITDPTTTKIVVAIATAIFILPYFLFSATAGQIADKYEKAGLIRLIKLWEVGVMILATVGFGLGGDAFVAFELTVLLLLGVQATFFGPVKYAILPDHLDAADLMGGNALIEAGTFLAILLGVIAGGLLATLLAIAVGGYAAAWFIPKANRAAPDLRINPNVWAETRKILGNVAAKRDLRLTIIAISWFWALGAVFLSQFPTFAKVTLGADESVQTLFLALFSIGIGAGAVVCGRLLRGEVSARLTPLGAVGMTLFIIDLVWASDHHAAPAAGTLLDVRGFLGILANWRIVGDLFMIALCGGLFTVPLYALIQARAEESYRSRVVAANNIVNALFIVLSG